MKKYINDFTIVEKTYPSEGFGLLVMTPADGSRLPEMFPGQFVQVKIDGSSTTFLRRPISICDYDPEANTLTLLVRAAGDGTRRLIEMPEGATVNMIFPLGNSFTLPGADKAAQFRPLLVGGGVGTAPMLLLAKSLKKLGCNPTVLVGARNAEMLLLTDRIAELATLHITTDDGSREVKGVVTDHPAMRPDENGRLAFDMIYSCGPSPMMKGVARRAAECGVECEVSLENMMACGMGACLCCVEKTVKGNVCVCTDGPVFNTKQLTW